MLKRSGVASNGVKILLVDDDSSVREILEHFLCAESYETAAVESAQEAIDALQCDRYSVVVTDLKMEPKDGFDVIEVARDRSEETEIVVVSAYLDDLSLERLRRLGVRYTATKPVDRRDFLEKIRLALDSVRRA